MSAIDPGHLADEDSLITPPHNDDNPCRGCPVMERICDDDPDAEDACTCCGNFGTDFGNGCSHSPWDMNA